MLLLIDNYDSFTYNLVQAFGEIDPGLPVRVVRNDQVTVEEIRALGPERIVISPGPCTPTEGGISLDVVRAFSGHVPLLGVCLGHQCIAYAAGGQVVRAERLVHGKTSLVEHDGSGILAGLSNPFQATRYHSLIVPEDSLPEVFRVTARCVDDPSEVMAMQHRTQPVFGVQFHPESFLTLEGNKLLANFLQVGMPSR